MLKVSICEFWSRAGRLGAQLLSDLLRHARELLQVRMRQHDHELVAAPARNQVVLAHGASEHLRHVLQGPVARLVSVEVVDGLEVVEVEHQEAGVQLADLRGPPIAAALVFRARRRVRDALLHVAAIAQSGKRVGQREVAQQVGHVLELTVEAAQLVGASLGAAPELADDPSGIAQLELAHQHARRGDTQEDQAGKGEEETVIQAMDVSLGHENADVEHGNGARDGDHRPAIPMKRGRAGAGQVPDPPGTRDPSRARNHDRDDRDVEGEPPANEIHPTRIAMRSLGEAAEDQGAGQARGQQDQAGRIVDLEHAHEIREHGDRRREGESEHAIPLRGKRDSELLAARARLPVPRVVQRIRIWQGSLGGWAHGGLPFAWKSQPAKLFWCPTAVPVVTYRVADSGLPSSACLALRDAIS